MAGCCLMKIRQSMSEKNVLKIKLSSLASLSLPLSLSLSLSLCPLCYLHLDGNAQRALPRAIQRAVVASLRSSHGRRSSAEIPLFIRRARRLETISTNARRPPIHAVVQSARPRYTIWDCPSPGRENAAVNAEGRERVRGVPRRPSRFTGRRVNSIRSANSAVIPARGRNAGICFSRDQVFFPSRCSRVLVYPSRRACHVTSRDLVLVLVELLARDSLPFLAVSETRGMREERREGRV